jgi:N6-L-threonylcarbamoyladenine synthase
VEQTGIKTLVIAGGVSANTELRNKLAKLMEKHKGQVYYPRHEFCTDNGAMIAYAGAQRLQKYGDRDLLIKARPRWSIEELPAI